MESERCSSCHTVSKIVYTSIIVALLIGVIIASYSMKGAWKVINIGFADIGAYGLIIFTFLIIQQIVSILNNNCWIPKITALADRLPKVGLQIVGYREDENLFRSSLITLSQQSYENIGKLIIGIDGH
jgi:hypothetical protein